MERIQSIKLLGVIFNEHLTWKNHMEMQLSKLKSSLYYVMRVKPEESLLTLFHSLIWVLLKPKLHCLTLSYTVICQDAYKLQPNYT